METNLTYSIIKKYLLKFVNLSENEIQQFIAFTEIITAEKGKIILDFDKKCTYQFFILKGILISYNTNENGENKVIQIAIENNWTGDLNSYTNDQLSSRIIIAYEKSELLILKNYNWKKLLELNPKFEKLFRIIFQNAYIDQTNRIASSMKYNSKQRLEKFLIENPNLVNRIQKKIIASYLDMSPETFSRLLKKTSLDLSQVF